MKNLINEKVVAITGASSGISELAYELGFEHPQSFSKLFKSKTRHWAECLNQFSATK